MGIIKSENLSHDYTVYLNDDETEKKRAISGITLDIPKGAFVAVLGHNGSGKSTFARHINALLLPDEGAIWIDGIKTSDPGSDIWKIRQKAGIVFQNPDNQIIGTSVEEDVGFGLENLGVPSEDIWRKVSEALEKVGMTAYRTASPNHLSGGQKQRVAIAGIVAMQPKCLVLDEPTAMLDPDGRKEVLSVLKELNEKEKVTVVLITHYMEEVTQADIIYVMNDGKVVMQGTPREIFSNIDELKNMRLDVPQITLLAHELRKAGIPVDKGILTVAELIDSLEKVCF